jgi:hypothetical protein
MMRQLGIKTAGRHSVRFLIRILSYARSFLANLSKQLLPSLTHILRGLITAAYEDAVKRFSTDLTHDKHKIEFVNGKVGLRDVQESVAQSLAKYEASQTHTGAARKWLHKVALRIQFYGNVLDVIAQHHPEYVSLAWGAIKFLLQVCNSRVQLKPART